MITRKMCVAAIGCLLIFVGCATSTPDGNPIVKQVSQASPISDSAKVPTTALRGETPPTGPATPTPEPAPAPATEAVDNAADMQGNYLIGPGDLLEFRSLDDPTLSTPITVRYDGQISLPLIPDLVVRDSTREQAEENIRKAYSVVFRDPQVSLTIRESLSKYYYVMGDVNRPSEYPYRRRISLLDAINNAGGLRINQRSGDTFVGQQGQLAKALIIRHVNGQREITEYDLRNLSKPGPHASETPVLPGDVIYVPEGVNLVYVVGEVRAPGVFPMTEDMKLLDLLLRTGGPNFSSAKLRHVVLLREVDETNTEVLVVDLKKILQTGRDIPLKPGDIVYVPRKDLLRAQEFVGRLTGSISPLMSLYSQAWETYYTAERYNQLYNSNTGSNTLQGLLNQLQTLGGLIPTTPLVPAP